MMMKNSPEKSWSEKEILNINSKRIKILEVDLKWFKEDLLSLDKNSLLMKSLKIFD